MLPSLVAAALLSLVAPVSVADLEKNPDKYNGRIVRVETVLKDFSPGETWHVTLGDKERIDVLGKTAPPGKNGDRVAITGLFLDKEHSYVRRAILSARMAVIQFDVTPKQLHKRGPFDGRLVRVEGAVKEIERRPGRAAFYVESFTLEVTWTGKPEIAEGDRVRVTGVFVSNRGTFLPGRIDVTKSGSVEKLGPK